MSDANPHKGAQRGSMYGSTKYRHAMENSTAQYLRTHTDSLLGLLTVSEPWTIRDVKLSREQLSGLYEKGVIDKCGTTRAVRHDGWNRTIGVWKLTPAARERLQHRRDTSRPAELPCGHTGFINEGDVLACKTCDEQYDKQVMR